MFRPRRGRVRGIRLQLPRMLVFVAVNAQQLPIAAVARIVVVVVILVMHRELAQPLAGEFARASRSDPGVKL